MGDQGDYYEARRLSLLDANRLRTQEIQHEIKQYKQRIQAVLKSQKSVQDSHADWSRAQKNLETGRALTERLKKQNANLLQNRRKHKQAQDDLKARYAKKMADE